jgi:hypothetical protein
MNIDLSTIDNNIKKSNEIIVENNKCFQQLKKKINEIQILKERIKSLDDSQNSEIIKITAQLNEKEEQLNDEMQKIKEISATDELTIDEIISEITIINNLLNNNFITDFLIEIKTFQINLFAEKKDQLLDYNKIINKTIQLKEKLKKTEEYLFETTIYKYMIKLINNYHHICIKIQNKMFKDSIVKIYEINKIIEKEKYIKHEQSVNESNYTNLLNDYEYYKRFINLINNLFKYDEQDINYDNLINELKQKNNHQNFAKILSIIRSFNEKFEFNELSNEYKIFDYFFYIAEIIANKQNQDIVNQTVIKHDISVELKKDKELLKTDFENAISQNKKNILEKISENKSLLTIIEFDDLENIITNTIKQINSFNNDDSQLYVQLLDIFVLEQQIKLKNILNEISENNQKIKELISIFKYKNIIFSSLFNLDLNIKVRDIIDILNNYLKTFFYYDYDNNFKQILIKDDLELLKKNINDIYNIEEKIKYFIEKREYDINFLTERGKNTDADADADADIETLKTLEKNIIIEQKKNLNLIDKIKVIMKNIKENSLNKILKKLFDNIKKNGQIIGEEKYNTLVKKIEEYFIFNSRKENLTIIIELNYLLDFCNSLLKEKENEIEIKNTINEMIILENEYNNENIKLLDKYNGIENIEYIIDEIEKFNKLAKENKKTEYFMIQDTQERSLFAKLFELEKLIKKNEGKDISDINNIKYITNLFDSLSDLLEFECIRIKLDPNSLSVITSEHTRIQNNFNELYNKLNKFFKFKKIIFNDIKLKILKIEIDLIFYFKSQAKSFRYYEEESFKYELNTNKGNITQEEKNNINKHKAKKDIENQINNINTILSTKDENQANILLIIKCIQEIITDISKINDDYVCDYYLLYQSYLCVIISELKTLLSELTKSKTYKEKY